MYLFTSAFANALIGAVLFALPPGIYPLYMNPEDPLHIVALIRSTWGISAAEDQHLGGLIMIIGGSVVFMYSTAYMLWSHRDESRAAA